MSDNLLGNTFKQRYFTYERGRYVPFIRTYYDLFNGNKAHDTIEQIPVGQYGRETTTSQKGSAWLTYQSLRRSNPASWSTWSLSRMDLGTAPFESIKRTMTHSHESEVVVDVREGQYRARYQGPYRAVEANAGSSSSLYPPVPGDLGVTMLHRGATAIAKTIPTNPVAGVSQFLGELREGVSLPGAAYLKRGGPGGIADEYVNVEFGLKPILGDLRKFGEAARTADKVIGQLKRDSGRLIRRRYTFPEERTTKTEVMSNSAWGSPPLANYAPVIFNGGPGQLTRTRVESRKFWFSGAYTYLYPDGDHALGRMQQAESRMNKLLGTRVTPELFWELTPWSWAADWVSNAGDVARNMSAFAHDGLVLRWGYIMCHYECEDTYRLSGVSLKGQPGGARTQTFKTSVKKRYRATPYGFGLDLAGFTTRQWAILGALGISRAQGML